MREARCPFLVGTSLMVVNWLQMAVLMFLSAALTTQV